jgi:hypothetical protein
MVRLLRSISIVLNIFYPIQLIITNLDIFRQISTCMQRFAQMAHNGSWLGDVADF